MQNPLQWKEGLSKIAGSGFLKKESDFPSNEPISVLDTGWSPSPSTSTSTFSSSLAGGGSTDTTLQKSWSIFMVPENRTEEALVQPLDSGFPEEKWVPELNPFPAVTIAGGGGAFGYDVEDWEMVMSESALLRWVPGELDANPSQIHQSMALGFSDQSCPAGPTMENWSSSHRDGEIGHGPINNQVTLNKNLLPPLSYPQEQEQLCLLQPPAKRQNLGVSGLQSQEPLKPPILEHQSLMGFLQNPTMAVKQEEVAKPPPSPERHRHSHHQQQAVYDQLYKAAELIQSGNFSHAQGILARLNYHLSPPEKPFQRAAFYFKEALLQLPLLVPPAKNPTPVDGILKMGAYKLLSEASPLIQFMNFTSNQALLEAIGDAESVHVIDFDVGFGAQWASFMQELPGLTKLRTTRACAFSLKITAFASPSTHHGLDLCLMHQTLTQFATDIGINLKLEVVNFDDFDPNSYPISPNGSPIVVNFPIWACSSRLSLLPSLLHFIKRLNPRIVVSLERDCDRPDLPFSQHILRSLNHYEAVLDSLNSTNLSPESVEKVERLLLQPMIESIVWGRFLGPASHVPHSRDVFASAGFYPVGFSSFSETQAEYVVKRSLVKGFCVVKRNGSLVLYWKRKELVLASAWRC